MTPMRRGGPLRAVTAARARRRRAPAPSVLVRRGGGEPQTLGRDDPVARAALAAAEALISASQRASDR